MKGAYDFLRENDITPDLYISVEPRRRPIKDPSKKSTYLMASRCNPEDLDDLKDYCVLLWHSFTEQESPIYEGLMGVGGGSTSGLRAVNIAYILGFKKIKMYGMDSCLMDSEKRIGQGKIHDIVKTKDVIVGDRTFICNYGMAAQAEDFQMIYDIMPGIHIDIFGDGLLAAICKERVRLGLPV